MPILKFTGERIVPAADNCEPHFALKMYQEHVARYLFASQFCTGKRVLDVGCGVGYGAHLLARQGASDVVAFDIDPATIEHAREHYGHPNLSFRVASISDLPLEESFDVVTCFEVIEHIERQQRLVRTIAASLNRDGCLIVSTPRNLGALRSSFHCREFSPFEFTSLLESCFPHVRMFFENNHFVSLVTDAPPHVVDRVHLLHPQFSLGQCDYMVAVASFQPLGFEPKTTMVVNDDQYVKLQERDVRVLHEAEDRLRSALAETNASLDKLRDQLSEATSTSRVLAAQLDTNHHPQALAALQTQVNQSHRSLDRMAEQLAEFVSTGNAAASQILLLGQEIAQLKKNVELSDRLAEAEGRCAGLTRSWQDAIQAQQAANARVGELEVNLAQLTESLKFAEEKARIQDGHIADLRHANTTLAEHLAEASSREATALESIAKEIADRQSTIEAHRARFTTEWENLHERYRACIEQNERQSAEIARLEAEATTRTRDLETALRSVTREVGRSHQLNAQLRMQSWKQASAENFAVLEQRYRNALNYIDYLHEAALGLYHEVLHRNGVLRDIYDSASWRITAPLRRANASFRGVAWSDPAADFQDPLPLAEYHPEFHEEHYLAHYPDVADAVARGVFRRAYDHYVRAGRAEGRSGVQQTPLPPVVRRASPAAGTGLPFRAHYDVVFFIGCLDGESHRYRVYNAVEALTKAGYSVLSLLDNQIDAFVNASITSRALVLFRMAYTEDGMRLVEYGRTHGMQVAWDVDDLIFDDTILHYIRVLNEYDTNFQRHYRNDVLRYRQLMDACDLVSCTTEYLAKAARQAGKKAAVVPNTLNYRQLEAASRLIAKKRAADDGEVRIGYFSGSNTHQVDFRSCEDALLEIMEKYPQCRFVLVGLLKLGPAWDRFAGRVEHHARMPYIDMLELLSTCDINLGPLEVGNPFCESKSELKIFEAGCVKTPTIASATSSYSAALTSGVDGCLASNRQEWFQAMERLVLDAGLRERLGEAARERALRQFGPEVQVDAIVRAFDLGAPSPTSPATTGNASLDKNRKLKISWIIPGLIIGGGGHRNILRAAYFLESFGHHLELYFNGGDLQGEELRKAVTENFYPLRCEMHGPGYTVKPCDVLFATHWTTVEPALKARHIVGEVMYFVQDFEPMFTPMGSDYILAESTYRQGLYCITSGPWCEQFLRREFHAEADHFRFPVDQTIYHPRPRTKANPNILFFAKPEMPRRCFELGTMALEHFHRRRPDVEIILFGSRHIEGRPLPFPATVHSLVPTLEDLANLYCNADLAVVFSTTNPSLVPYEMLACGLPVVDLGREGNETNYGGQYDIALLADPSPEVMAFQISELLDNPAELSSRARKGIEFVKAFPSEEGMATRVEELILRRVLKSRSAD